MCGFVWFPVSRFHSYERLQERNVLYIAEWRLRRIKGYTEHDTLNARSVIWTDTVDSIPRQDRSAV